TLSIVKRRTCCAATESVRCGRCVNTRTRSPSSNGPSAITTHSLASTSAKAGSPHDHHQSHPHAYFAKPAQSNLTGRLHDRFRLGINTEQLAGNLWRGADWPSHWGMYVLRPDD